MLPAPINALGNYLGKSAVWAMALLALLAWTPGSAAIEPPQMPQVHGEGCVEAGVQAHCLVLRDIATGHLFNLIFKAARPPVGLGIEFTGVLHAGPSACMKGTAVEVTGWVHKASIKCTPGQAGKRAR